MSALPATELLPLPATGRRFSTSRIVRLGDVDTRGHARFDAIARYLQDVASDDALSARLPNAMGWVVRRTLIRVDEPCRLNETVALTTFCTGAGRSWAERRTTIVGDAGGAIEAVSLWVQIDVDSGRPARLGDEFLARYGEAAAGRTVSSKLSLPGPPSDARRGNWSFRATDLDPFDHVNNAAQWALLESLDEFDDRRGVAELEYLSPVGLGTLELLVSGTSAWLLVGDRTASAYRWTPAGTAEHDATEAADE
jgi:acyl-ACP thioesterase